MAIGIYEVVHFACQSRSWFALYTLGCIKQPITTQLTISNTMQERNLCSQGMKCPIWFKNRTKSYSIYTLTGIVINRFLFLYLFHL